MTSVATADRAATFGDLAGHFARHGIVGAVAGTIGLGVVGLRGTMRLLTITSGQAGVITGNGNRAGDFTFEGSAFLVGAGMLLGVLFACLYLVIRKGLPSNPWLSSLLTAPLIARAVVLDPTNVDFRLFGPAWIGVVGFTFGCFIYTLMLESGLRWLESHWHLPIWANLVFGTPPMVFLVALLGANVVGLQPLTLAIVVLVAIAIGFLWKRPAWHQSVVSGLAVIWVVGGICLWLQAAVKLV